MTSPVRHSGCGKTASFLTYAATWAGFVHVAFVTSAGSAGDAYDNALAEMIFGL